MFTGVTIDDSLLTECIEIKMIDEGTFNSSKAITPNLIDIDSSYFFKKENI